MIIIDSSVWIAHIRSRDSRLMEMLVHGDALMHPYVLGEIALGIVSPRARVLNDMRELPAAPVVSPDEALGLIESAPLYGSGIGYVDAHLVASARLCGASLWTLDRRLSSVALSLGLAFSPLQ